jgi:hypothetical protein
VPLAALVAARALAAGGDGRAPAGPAGHRDAVLTPLTGDPFRVRGARFGPRGRVRVTVTPTGRATIVRRVRATARGTFVLLFRGVTACRGVKGVAAGSRGSRAAFALSSVRCAGGLATADRPRGRGQRPRTVPAAAHRDPCHDPVR